MHDSVFQEAEKFEITLFFQCPSEIRNKGKNGKQRRIESKVLQTKIEGISHSGATVMPYGCLWVFIKDYIAKSSLVDEFSWTPL